MDNNHPQRASGARSLHDMDLPYTDPREVRAFLEGVQCAANHLEHLADKTQHVAEAAALRKAARQLRTARTVTVSA